jgi:hypothetical protein
LGVTEPGLYEEDADFELVGGEGRLAGPAGHGLEVASLGRDGPPDLAERQAEVLQKPARHQAAEDENWPPTGRGADVQELGAERETEVRQPRRAVIVQACIRFDRPLRA